MEIQREGKRDRGKEAKIRRGQEVGRWVPERKKENINYKRDAMTVVQG